MTLHRSVSPRGVVKWWCHGATPRGEIVFFFAHRESDGSYRLRYRDVGLTRVIRERPAHTFADVKLAANRLQEVQA